MYLDSKLAASVVDELLEDEHHARGRSDGVDLVEVAKHALSARRRQRVRDGVLAILALLAIESFLTFSLRRLLLVLIGLWLVVVCEMLLTRYSVLAGALGPHRGGPAPAPMPANPAMRRRLAEIAQEHQGNTAVYSGYIPFVGSGQVVRSWSFALDVNKPAEGSHPPVPFKVTELHGAVVAGVRRLDWSDIVIEDRVFVTGSELRASPHFLPDPFHPPVCQVDDRTVQELLVHPRENARHYLCMRFTAWHGELVVTLFLRFVLRKESLFVEGSFSLLPPIRRVFHEVDDIVVPPTVGQIAGQLGRAAKATPGLALRSLPRTVGTALAPINRHLRSGQEDRAIREHLSFDYGARSTVRERASDTHYQRYFQQLDEDMYVKVVEKRVLDSIVAFLDSKGVDTGELVKRQTTIMNNGVMVTGGSLMAESIAVGSEAKATSRVTDAVKTLVGKGE